MKKIKNISWIIGAAFIIVNSQTKVDVVVYGGTSGGVIAAVTAKMLGKTAVIIEDHNHLGGMSASGLGFTDIHFNNGRALIKGVALDFYRRLGKVYGEDESFKHEPHVAEGVFNDFLKDYNIPVFLNERLDLIDGVLMSGQRIVQIKMESGKTFTGKMFIDASYEGDVMAKAGVSYFVGRENNSDFNETINGVTRQGNSGTHRFIRDVDPYVIQGNPASGVIPHVEDLGLQNGTGVLVDGTGDKKIQAYNFRLCASRDAANSVPFPQPPGYDPWEFELLFRNFEAGDTRRPLKIDFLRNGKYDINDLGAFSTDGATLNWNYPEGNYQTRDSIIQMQINYQQGILWSLANNPRVPQSVRDNVNSFGLCKDEFVDNNNWPYEVYIRETRRMRSDFVMTQNVAKGLVTVADPVAEAGFGMDSHLTQIFVDENGHAKREGVMWEVPPAAFPISYRSLVPKKGEAENLFVPVCLSATHAAHGSIRMEPQFMMLSQASAAAANIAINDGLITQDVPYPKLKLLLDSINGVFPDLFLLKRPLIIDNDAPQEVTLTGDWTNTSFNTGHWGEDYLIDNNEGKGNKTVRYTPNFSRGDEYQVYLRWVNGQDRSNNVTITINHDGGTSEVTVNMVRNGGIWNLLGTYTFSPGGGGYVEISNSGTNGTVVADAVGFVPMNPLPVDKTISNHSEYQNSFFVISVINGKYKWVAGKTDNIKYEIHSLDGKFIFMGNRNILDQKISKEKLKDGLYFIVQKR